MNPDQDPQTSPDRRPELHTHTVPKSVDEMHVCVLCAGRLVHPFDWVAEGPKHWRVLLRCPDCEGVREGLFTQEAIEGFSDELDRGSGVLIRALDKLTRENMTAEIDILVRALEDDLIVPSDF
jgi:hypothetical protein